MYNIMAHYIINLLERSETKCHTQFVEVKHAVRARKLHCLIQIDHKFQLNYWIYAISETFVNGYLFSNKVRCCFMIMWAFKPSVIFLSALSHCRWLLPDDDTWEWTSDRPGKHNVCTWRMTVVKRDVFTEAVNSKYLVLNFLKVLTTDAL